MYKEKDKKDFVYLTTNQIFILLMIFFLLPYLLIYSISGVSGSCHYIVSDDWQFPSAGSCYQANTQEECDRMRVKERLPIQVGSCYNVGYNHKCLWAGGLSSWFTDDDCGRCYREDDVEGDPCYEKINSSEKRKKLTKQRMDLFI